MAARRGLRLSLFRLIRPALLIGLLVLVACGAVTAARLYGDAMAIKHRLDRVQGLVGGDESSGLNAGTLAVLREEMAGGQQDFAALKAHAAPLLALAGRLGWLPRLGPSLAALPHVMAMGESFLSAGALLLDGADPLLNSVLGDETAASLDALSITERALPLLLDAQPRFVEAQDKVEQAVAEREQIDSGRLLPALGAQLTRLDKYLPALRSASQAAAMSPVLLGAVRPMTYLVLAQNNDELRPTGGFISAIGVVTLDNGKITRMDIMDNNAVDNWERDHPTPPEPLTRYMNSELWVIRDANFWPDYPTSARALEYFAGLDLDLAPAGIIAIDQMALQILVGGMGSVVVPEYDNDVLTGDNVVDKIRIYWQPSAEFIQGVEEGVNTEWEQWETWHKQRKQFMSVLIEAMKAKLETDARSLSMGQLAKAVLRALDEKHVLIYLHDPLGGGINDGRWGGAIPATDDDYLFVVDTNMGFNKANGVVTRSLDYAVSIEDSGLARGRLVVQYDNTSTRNVECLHDTYYEETYDLLMNRCYFNYLRVYLPAGATLIADENGNDMQSVGTESGKQVWATWMVIPPREQPQVALGYYLPEVTLRHVGDGYEYRLLVQKQPGTDTTPLRVTVTLPAGMTVVGATPAPAAQSAGMVQFESGLVTDQEFRVVIR